ncbi:deaminase (plasmid) [Cellulomonas sp. WB94]|uniref:dihydrofolate reductase family protein n=1 Tax=Cellulomonas sp. WB94 TaxID=2173174 RepID=UPI000D57662C|nr:dihydrofolate reductase family protein [Cellulomonas sp. WB94]PVU81529.1 deaminase [Cellulomonas sp. WB94]
MTRTQYYVAASIDGYIADPAGSLDWLTPFEEVPGVTAHFEGFLEGVGAIAMGASTYEFLLGMGMDEWPYPHRRTWVFTHRDLPRFPGADLELTAEDVGAVHARMAVAAAGRNIWLVGGGGLVAQFAALGLLDELWLGVVPVVLGGGAPVLPLRLPGNLTLEDVTRFGAGFLELRYRVGAAAAEGEA